MRALAATLIIALFVPVATRAQQLPIVTDTTLVFEAPRPAPEKYEKLRWHHENQLTLGYWFTADQVIRVNQRIAYLEYKAAADCIEAGAGKAPKSKWIALGIGVGIGIAGGVAIGFAVK